MLVLEDVLHVPSAICNGFCPLLLGQSIILAGSAQGYDEYGRPVWYASKFCGLKRLQLFGNPQGKSLLAEEHSKGMHFPLSMFLTPEDKMNAFGSR